MTNNKRAEAATLYDQLMQCVLVPQPTKLVPTMETEAEWSKAVYAESVSSRCWWCTVYDGGWDACPALSEDNELRQIVGMEQELSAIPVWAEQIVERAVNFLPPCGHYLFPRAYLDVVNAIGSQTTPGFVHGCFTVEQDRKRQMMDYVLCLDAWLQGAQPQEVAHELNLLGYRRVDWGSVCQDLWQILGKHSETKDLLIERLIHSQRWKIKNSPWDDDHASLFEREQYLGDLSRQSDTNGSSYVGSGVPRFDETSSPKVRKVEARLAEICPDWDWFRYTIEYGWLCAPKAFRFLERLLWAIGKERVVIHTHDHPMQDGELVPAFLQCQDTYPDEKKALDSWPPFLAALKAWWKGRPEQDGVAHEVCDVLGEITPVKQWLVRLFVRKLELPEHRAVVPRGKSLALEI
tara:strand:- start:672 stop:1889 length:1218 start_codon:yes stop_codon:yes gene_type:complete